MRSVLIDDSRGGIETAARLAASVYPLLKEHPVLLLKGDLGAGKTTFCKLLLRHAGLHSEVSSPSFGLVNEYLLPGGGKVHHLDLYRIRHPEELEEFGFSEYLDSGHPCIIEWPEIAEELLDVPHLSLEISHLPEGRHYRLSKTT